MKALDQVLELNNFPILYSTLTEKGLNKSIRLLRIFGVKACKVIFVTSEDRVYCYGLNRDGSLGLGTFEEHIRKPQLNRVLTNKKIMDIAPGYEHCIALTSSGQCYAWGHNRYGQLGIKNIEDQCTPQLIEDLTDLRVVQIYCGAYHSMALTSDGELFAWGHNTFAQLGDRTYNSREVPTQVLISEKVVSISCGTNHSVALSESGRVYVWGNNTYGQLGRHPDKDVQRGRLKPMSNRPRAIIGQENIRKVVCGPNHSLLLTTDGYIMAFGDNSVGQIGIGSTDPQYAPIKLNKSIKIKDIYCHFDNNLSIAVSEDNRIYIWGMASYKRYSKPKLVNKSFGKSLFDIYVKLANNKITFQTINIEDINRFVVKSEDNNRFVVESEDNNRFVVESEDNNRFVVKSEDNNRFVVKSEDNHRNEVKANSDYNSNDNQKQKQIKDYEKEVNISPRNEFKAEEEDKEESDDFLKETIWGEKYAPIPSPKRETTSSMVSPLNSGQEFLRHLYQSFNNPNNSDLTIIAGDGLIYCHKTILQIRNPIFWNVLREEMNGDSNQLAINPKSSELFLAFLQHMYGIEPEIDVQIVEDLGNMAKIFNEPELQHLCDQLVQKWGISINVWNVCALYQKAINEGLTELETNCIEFVAQNWKPVVASDGFMSMEASLSKRLMNSIDN